MPIDINDGPSIEEYDLPFSELQLWQIENDALTKTKMKVCPICNIDFIDDPSCSENTCGNKFCVEEYRKMHKKYKNKKWRKY